MVAGVKPAHTGSISGQPRTIVKDKEACRARCSKVPECVYWVFWAIDRGCNLSPSTTKFIPTALALTSRLDGKCFGIVRVLLADYEHDVED